MRLRGAEKFGTKAEVKNLNSFRFLKLALDYEIGRQVALIESGGRVIQESRLYNPDAGETVSMRSKEHAHDYRYFPEPDLPPLRIHDEWMDRVKSRMPELPAARRARFIESYGLRDYDSDVLTATRALGDYFERVATSSGDPKGAANWVMGELAGALKEAGKEIDESPVSAEHLGALVAMIAQKKLSGKLAKEIFPKMFETGRAGADDYRSRGIGADQRCGRTDTNRGRSDCVESEAGGAVSLRQDGGDWIFSGCGDESESRPGRSGGGESTPQRKIMMGRPQIIVRTWARWCLENSWRAVTVDFRPMLSR